MNAIVINNLSKKYTIYPNPKHLSKVLLGLDKESKFNVKLAINNINLTVLRGQTCAIIGRNGSGKSTFLGLISGIISPTTGEVVTDGRISSLLELGAGFQLELTGRENIIFNASILGASKKIMHEKLEDIIEFSGLDEQIDDPIKTYSSGMILRLGFSIAVYMDFDILLIDEILSVGDLLFRRKCISKMRQFKGKGKTILLASHSLADVAAFCDRVIFLDNGQIVMDGPVEEVLKQYWEECEKEENRIHKKADLFNQQNIYGEDTKKIQITHGRFLNCEGNETDSFETGQQMIIRIGYHAIEKVENPLFRVQFFRNDGLWVHGANTCRQNLNLGILEGYGEIELNYKQLNLLEADYFVSIGIWPDEYKSFISNVAYDLHKMAYIIHIKSKRSDGAGIVSNPFKWKLIEN